MKQDEINQLLRAGATDQVRRKLKRLSILDRMKVLNSCIPMIKDNPRNKKFFGDNFSVEIGALLYAEGDVEVATNLYHTSKKNK